MQLWLVEVDERDFEYDAFVSGVVWAETPDEAERLIRSAKLDGVGLPRGKGTRLIVKPAPESGIVHQHWHAA